MNKKVVIVSLVTGSVLAFLAVNHFVGKTSKTGQGEESISEASPKVAHITEAKWDDAQSAAHGEAGKAGAATQSADSLPTGTPKELTVKLVKVSGIEKKFLTMAPMLKEQLEMMIADQQMSAKDRDEFLAKFRKNISGEKLLADYQEKLAENFSQQELTELVGMYEDPLVKKFNQVNNDLSDPEKLRDLQDEITDFMKDADVGSIPPERQKHFARIDKAFNVTNQAVDLTLSLFSLSGEGDPQATKEIKTAIEREIQKGFLFTMRDFSDQDASEMANRVDNPIFGKSNKLMHEVTKNPLIALMKDLQSKNDQGKKPAAKSAAASAAPSAP